MNKIRATTLVTILLAACGKDKAGEAPAAPESKGTPSGEAPAAAAAAPAKLGWVELPSLGLTLEMPSDGKAEAGAGSSLMVMSDSAPDCVVMVAKEDPDLADSYDKTVDNIKQAKMGNGPMKGDFAKNEKTPDGGFKLEWTHTSAIDQKDLYGVSYRVVIDKTNYSCSRNTNTAEGRECVAHACSTLKKK